MPIEITVSSLSKKQVKVGVAAHPGLSILGSELATGPGQHTPSPAITPAHVQRTRRNLAQNLPSHRISFGASPQNLWVPPKILSGFVGDDLR